MSQSLGRTDRPHVVLVGAGASRAACPNGDAHGRHVPVINDLTRTVGLEDLFARAGIDPSSNFEVAYSSLHNDHAKASVLDQIERRVSDYFRSLRLPSKPTVYDYLVLSLRPKDVIATFNWDPFLFAAGMRNHRAAPMPKILFLHGNVAVGVCLVDHRKGPSGSLCARCHRPLEDTKLLYPVGAKDYASDPYIAAEWEAVRTYLKHAYLFTIFGYSAPESDVEAKSLLKESWGDSEARELEETEIIDVISEDNLRERWRDFICSHHYQVWASLHASMIGRYPRRTCEAMWGMLMELKEPPDNRPPTGVSLESLQAWFRPLVDGEGAAD